MFLLGWRGRLRSSYNSTEGDVTTVIVLCLFAGQVYIFCCWPCKEILNLFNYILETLVV